MAYDTAIVIGTTIVAFAFLYFATKITPKNWPIQLMFIIMSFLTFINTGGLMREIINVQSIGGNVSVFLEYHVLILVFGFMVWFLYVFVNFIFELVDHIGKEKKEKEKEEAFGSRLGAT